MSVRWKVVIVSIVVIATATALFVRLNKRESIPVRVELSQFEVLVADDTRERARGLSGLSSLAENQVMLFVFPSDGRHGIWMKDMRFSIDILWLDAEGQVVHIEEHVSPATYPEVFTPRVQARYVVEMNAGLVEKFHIEVGQKMEAWLSG